MSNRFGRYAIWIGVAIIGAVCWGVLALGRGETVNAGWLLFAAIASYAIAYRFYARYIQRRVLETDDSRATPGERLNNGKDFEPMDRRVLFGHHFAAIAGAGPLVGPVLAAQMGFLPGTVWIIVGVILAGAVQDMTILFFSMRRDGKSLGQMAREEIGPVGGAAALVAVLAIMVILLAVLALVVVNALADSPWGSFSIAMTLPIALLMGFYLRFLRPGRVLEVSAIGVGLLLLAIAGGGWISESSGYAEAWTFSGVTIAIALIVYGFVASVLPVWVLLGADGVGEKQKARARMGLMVDRPTHYGDLSGWANAYLFARSYGMEEKKAESVLAELFDYFGLGEYRDDKAKTYSYGMGKKLALIEAMAHGPEVLILDEPSLGLDYTSQLAYQKKIRDLSASGVAILVASNQVDEVEALCDRVAFLYKGRLAALGTPEEFISSLEGTRRIVATLRNPVEYDALGGIAGVERVTPEGRNLVIHCAERPGLIADVVAGLIGTGGDITDLAVRRPNLEDVYVKLTGEALRDAEV